MRRSELSEQAESVRSGKISWVMLYRLAVGQLTQRIRNSIWKETLRSKVFIFRDSETMKQSLSEVFKDMEIRNVLIKYVLWEVSETIWLLVWLIVWAADLGSMRIFSIILGFLEMRLLLNYSEFKYDFLKNLIWEIPRLVFFLHNGRMVKCQCHYYWS